RLALELADKLGDFEEAVAAGVAPGGGAAEAALHALERLGYATAEADRALRQALAANGGGDAEMLVRQALQLLTHGGRCPRRLNGSVRAAARPTARWYPRRRPGPRTSVSAATPATCSSGTRGRGGGVDGPW